jgi:hypothetical protein
VTRALAKTAAAVLAAGAAVVLGLDSTGAIDASRRLLVSAVVVSAVLAASATIGGAWAEWRARRLGARRDLADVQLTAAAWAIVDLVGAGLDYRDLGLAAYRVERIRWKPWAQRLRRVHRVRASRRPVASNIAWRPGKGVIGRCVAQREVQLYDLQKMYEDLGQPSEAEWRDVPDDLRLGLSYAEYLDVRNKYSVVVATPVIDDSGTHAAVVGCVALDGPEGWFDDLSREDVQALLNTAADGLLHQAL